MQRTDHHSLVEQVEHVIEMGRLRPTLVGGARILLETVIVPTLLLYACMVTVGQFYGLIAVLGWCALTVLVRVVIERRLPGTVMLVVAMVVVRTAVALGLSSVYIYLLQPVAGSMLMAVLFIGSAMIGRPITLRLAQDYVRMPVRLMADHRVQRLFIEVSVLWGFSRLCDAGLSVGVLHWGVDTGVLSRGVFSTLLTLLSIAVCAWWVWRRLSRIEGVRFQFATA